MKIPTTPIILSVRSPSNELASMMITPLRPGWKIHACGGFMPDGECEWVRNTWTEAIDAVIPALNELAKGD